MSTSHAMSSADAAWLHMDRPTNLMVINSVLWFDEPVDWDAYRGLVRERLVERFDRFRQRPVEGLAGPHWEDVELDLDLHFHHVALPSPGDRRALEEFVSDRVATLVKKVKTNKFGVAAAPPPMTPPKEPAPEAPAEEAAAPAETTEG